MPYEHIYKVKAFLRTMKNCAVSRNPHLTNSPKVIQKTESQTLSSVSSVIQGHFSANRLGGFSLKHLLGFVRFLCKLNIFVAIVH